jgi:peptidoglycan biosynthesis protein MviN/MurJ (putative lipid II flippase)
MTPVRVGLAAVAVNSVLDLTLMWPLAELGMAASTAIAAAVQTIALVVLFSRGHVAMPWRAIVFTLVRMLVATVAMMLVGWFVLRALPSSASTWNAIWRVATPLAACVFTYLALIFLFGREEWRQLVSHEAAE